MKSRIVVRPRAEEQLESAARWWAEHRSEDQAEAWYTGFVKAIKSLHHDAQRCPLAIENEAFPFEVRELRYGLGRRPTHRALFTIRPDMVYVFLIRHLAQRSITIEDY